MNELGRVLLENSLNQSPNGKILNQNNQLKTKKLNEIFPEESVQKPVNILEDEKFLNSYNTLHIELETIRPAINIPALNLYDKNNLKTVLHFARDLHLNCVNVIVISTTSMNVNEALKTFIFQAAVTKVSF